MSFYRLVILRLAGKHSRCTLFIGTLLTILNSSDPLEASSIHNPFPMLVVDDYAYKSYQSVDLLDYRAKLWNVAILIGSTDDPNGDFNQLDDFGGNQCDLEGLRISTGRLFYTNSRKDREIWLGSAEAVGNRRTILSAAHIFAGIDHESSIFDSYDGKHGLGYFVFRLFEMHQGACQEIDYKIITGKFNNANDIFDEHSDMVVMALERDIPADYLPLRVGSELDVFRAINGYHDIAIAGFANH